MTYPCPRCHHTADLTGGCPGCGRGPDPDAAEVVRLDAEIATLTARLADARRVISSTDAELRAAWRWREAAAARVRAALVPGPGPAVPVFPAPSAAAPAPAAAAHGAPVPALATPPGASARSPEASTRLVQNALFLLGGLLLGVAAIVFTAVAWSQFGVGGRAALLAGFTGAALAVPPVAVRRGLTATAETFAAVGLLLVLLDGYAAWYVDLFGVTGHSTTGYAGAVCAVTAAVAVGYEHVTGLTGPRFAALVVAQPVLPLLVAPLHPDAAGWSFTLSAVAALDLAVIHLRRRGITPLGITAYALGFCSVMGAGISALLALAVADRPGPAAMAGAALTTAALVPAAGAVLARAKVAQAVTGAAVVVALGLAGAQLAELLGGAASPVLIGAVALALAAAVSAVRPLLPVVVHRGPRIGALIVVAVPAVVAVIGSLDAAVSTIGLAWPVFHAPSATPDGDWRLPAVLGLLTVGFALLVPRSWVGLVTVGGFAAVAFAGPAAVGLPWSSAPVFDLAAVALVMSLTLRGFAAPVAGAPPAEASPAGAPPASPPLAAAVPARRSRTLAGPAFVAVVLVAHAVIVSFGRPGVAAATLAAISLLGLTVAALSRRSTALSGPAAALSGPPAATESASPADPRALLGGTSLAIAFLAVPAAAWTAAAALTAPAAVQSRIALAAVALLVGALHAVSRWWTGYRGFALAAVLLGVLSTPAWALASGDPSAIYAGVALVLIAAVLPAVTAPGSAAPDRSSTVSWSALTATPLLLALVAAAGPSLFAVLARPLAWTSHAWSGRPAGTGLEPFGHATVVVTDVVALVLLAAAAGLAAALLHGRAVALRAAAPALAVAVPMALTAAGATWPVVPAATLLIGLTGLLSVALRPAKASGTGGFGAAGTGSPLPLTTGLTVVHAAISILMVVAGFAGLLPTHGSTLAALGATLIAGAVSGVAARHLPARVTGWLTAVAASLGVAFTAGRAFELPLPTTAFAVLGAAASALALGATLSYRGLHPAHRDTVHPSAADPNVAGPSAAHVTTAWPSAGRSDSAQRITAPRRLEARAVQAAAHAGAVLALLLTWGSARHAAVVCTLWGVALGLRALLPGERATVRRLLVVAAATTELSGWWLLIAAAQVSTLEAYTLPAAAVALLAGWLGLRSRPSLGSWTALGPALAAALLPTLASVLVGEGQPIRRLLLGLGALAVVLAGAQTRRRAPVITGGAVLAIVALHELILVWDLLPRWIPLAAGGLLLVGLAMTVERRRRDLSRVRAALTRMS